MIDPELDELRRKRIMELEENLRKKEMMKMPEDRKVMVYSTPTCPYCHMAKDYLKEKKISFVDIDVASDPSKAQEMMDKSGQMGVPVIDINGKIIVGFNREAIDTALSS